MMANVSMYTIFQRLKENFNPFDIFRQFTRVISIYARQLHDDNEDMMTQRQIHRETYVLVPLFLVCRIITRCLQHQSR